MADISKSELKEEIEKILKDADLRVWTTKKVIQQLEKQYDSSIRQRKALIDEMVLDYVNRMDADKSEEEEEVEEEEVEEEKIESSDEEKPKPKRGRRAATATSKRGVTKTKDAKEKKPKRSGGGTGFTRSYKLSPELAKLMGADEMPRHAVVKRIWALVKENNLYDPNNKQFAICDDALFKVIGKQRFRVFGMMKYLKSHFLD